LFVYVNVNFDVVCDKTAQLLKSQTIIEKVNVSSFLLRKLRKNIVLSISKYKEIEYEEVEYEKPEVLKKEILELEEEIIKELKELEV